MKTTPRFTRLAIPLLCGGLILSLYGPMANLVPTVEAAPANLVNRLKNKIKRLKRQLRIARRPASATPVPPASMAFIPAGAFVMGDETNGSGEADELPLHTVTLSAFFIDQFEVTKALWDSVAAWGAANGYSDLPAGGGQGPFHPVQGVTWHEVVKWCNARSEMEGLMPLYYTDATQTTLYKMGNIDLAESFVEWTANGFRLPTEAEWEKAARGRLAGNTFPWGNTIGGGDANYNLSGDPFDGTAPDTTPIGYYDGDQVPAGVNRANGYGLYDVAGNVLEWCWDRHGFTYYASSPANDPTGSGNRLPCAPKRTVGQRHEFSALCQPLRQLSDERRRFRWGSDREERAKLTAEPPKASPEPIALRTAIGGGLLFLNPTGRMLP